MLRASFSSTTFGFGLNVSDSLKFHFWSSFPPAERRVSLLGLLLKDDLTPINLYLRWTGKLWVARVLNSELRIPRVNTAIIGELLATSHRDYKGSCLTGGVFDFLSPHTWFVLQSGTTMSGAATSFTKAENAERVKREPTDPHKQALSFMASVTPSLLKSDSQTFKHHWSTPPLPPSQPHHHHQTPSPTQFTHSREALSCNLPSV